MRHSMLNAPANHNRIISMLSDVFSVSLSDVKYVPELGHQKHMLAYPTESTVLRQDHGDPRTYQRAVLEGQTISLKCPYLLHPSIEDSTQKQTGPLNQDEVNSHPRVKWFRNHVPLLNANHPHESDVALFELSDAPMEVDGRVPVTDEQDYSATTAADGEITELKPTTAFPVPTAPDLVQLQTGHHSTEELAELKRLVTSENVNELTGVRKGISALESSHTPETSLYVNSIGELVINRIPRNLAGKYTCLSGGIQSEVLLDVLTDGRNEDLTNSKINSDRKETAVEGSVSDQDTHRFYEFEMIGNSNGLSRLDLTPHGNSNNQAPKEKGETDFDELTQKLSLSEQRGFNRRPSIGSSRLTASSKGNSSAHDSIYPRSTTGTDSFISPQAVDSLAVDYKRSVKQDNSLVYTALNKTTSSGDQGYLAFSFSESGDPTLTEPKVSNLLFTNRQRVKHHQVHKLNVETIQVDDVRVVPGLLYTKQQLYCPSGLKDAKIRHIGTLIQIFCNSNDLELQPTYSPEEQSECNRLSERLLLQIMGQNCSRYEGDAKNQFIQEKDTHFRDGSSISNFGRAKVDQSYNTMQCFDPIFEITWFKDGRKLEFSPEGKGIDSSLNVKLINWANQSNVNLIDNNRSKTSSDALPGVSSHVPAASAQLGTILESTAGQLDGKNRKTIKAQERSSEVESFPWSRGRVLEIDGITRENAGRYTCALELSMTKLLLFIQKFIDHRQTNNHFSPKLPERVSVIETSSGHLAQGNHNRPDSKINLSKSKEEKRVQGTTGNEQATIKPTSGRHSSIESGSAQSSVRSRDVLWDGSKRSSICATLKSALDVDGGSERHFKLIMRKISSLLIAPTAIQTFSLTVSERPANSCDLWSTIGTASSAFARRRLAEFKRLRRSQQSPQQQPQQLIGLDLDVNRQLSRNKRSTLKSIPLRPRLAHADLSQTEASTYVLLTKQADSTGLANKNDLSNQLLTKSGFAKLEYLMSAGSPVEQQQNSDRALSSSTSARHLGPTDGDLSSQPATELAPVEPTEAHQVSTRATQDQLLVDSSENSTGRHTFAVNEPPHYANQGRESTLNSPRRSQSEILAYSSLGPGQQLSKASHSGTVRDGSSVVQTTLDVHPVHYSRAKRFPAGSVDNSLPSGDLAQGYQGSSLEDGTPIFIINDDAASENPSRVDFKSILRTDQNRPSYLTTISQRRADLKSSLMTVKPRFSARSAAKSVSMVKTAELFPAKLEQPEGITSKLSDSRVIDSVSPNIINRMAETSSPIQAKIEMSHKARSNSSNETPEQEYKPEPSNTHNSLPQLLISSYESDLDESLMWTANQYLYIHMKAIAASSMFGAEVDVEWSNERANVSSLASSPSAKLSRTDMGLDASINNAKRRDNSSPQDRYHVSVPFATIDVISDRSLLLQCTAHALGRVPEINWYKRIESIPNRFKNLDNIARRIDNFLFWPLTELDLINSNGRENSFVASQTVTIFDNLANQTFTVVNSLQLSHYNDHDSYHERPRLNESPISDCNLYACIVDADVRHNYATLGVRYIETPRKVPTPNRFELPGIRPEENSLLAQRYSNFDLYRQDHYDFKELWTPIENRSSVVSSLIDDKFKLGPTMLSVVVVSLFGFLITLIYLTLKSYRNLTQLETHQINIALDFDGQQRSEASDINLGHPHFSINASTGQLISSRECSCNLNSKTRRLSCISARHDDEASSLEIEKSERRLDCNSSPGLNHAHDSWVHLNHEGNGYSSSSTYQASESLECLSPDYNYLTTFEEPASCYLDLQIEEKKTYLVENPICFKE